MGTEKRERQKANRQIRMELEAKQQQQAATRKKALLIAAAVGVAVLLALVFWLVGRATDDDADTTVTTTTTAVADPTTTAATEAAAPTVPGGTLDGAVDCSVAADIPSSNAPESAATTPAEERIVTFSEPMSPDCIDVTAKYLAFVETNRGDFTIELDPTIAPATVASFIGLAEYDYFDNTTCHRIVTDFVVQCGSPDGSGSGDPGYSFADELPDSVDDYEQYSVAMANSGPATNGSQFFVVTTEQGAQGLGTPSYSLFGKVVSGTGSIDSLNLLGTPAGTTSGLVQITDVTITKLA